MIGTKEVLSVAVGLSIYLVSYSIYISLFNLKKVLKEIYIAKGYNIQKELRI